MAEINRNGSPMNICDESLDGEPGAVEKRKRDLESKQNSRSSFLIGTIEDVNRKIGKLEQRLQSYTQLVVESRASDHPDAEALHPTSARGRMRYQERERENRDVCKFAGIYTLKSTFLPNLSDRMKNISKISMNPSKEKLHVKKDKDPSKPRFVELHQYPGYDPLELTPLPGHDATEIFQIVVDASVNLDKKPKYEPEFKRLFFSPMSQAVLQDTFWYVFLDSFQPNPTAQQKLFNRVAHNYVKLIFYAKNPLFRDTFLKEYPRLMAQALYVSFCHCFSDSYRQFGETFKNDLMYLVYGWIAGIRPSPRCWLEWNFTKLEPANINSKEDILNKSKNKTAMSFNFDYLDSLVSSHPSQYPSSLSLNQSASKSSVGSNRNQRRNRHTTRIFSRTINPLQTHCSSSPGDKQDSNLIEAVADAQSSPLKSTARESLDTQRSSQGKQTVRDVADTQRSLNPKHGGKDKEGIEALSPIREMTSEEEAQEKKRSQYSVSVMRDSAKKTADHEMKSHPAFTGPDFLKAAFNLNGRSPLVAHFLRMRNLTADMNLVVRIQHTEIDNLPPIDAPTYQDVIKQSSRTVGTIGKQFQEMFAKNQKETATFLKRERKVLREHRRRENALLANKPEVKRLSDLLVLDQGRGLDSISAGSSKAVEASLMAHELP
ncbi:protein FAM227B-like isoform X5 [Littorina saxatilis]|uniref:protein FAM227B-like isoform X5 n=1 Tax=Littorina saxatilis TaxID=31220 RepID=UPI0038B4A840